MIATDDRMIPPDAQRAMAKRAGATVVEVKGSHAVYVSQPSAVAALIEQAARKVKAATAARPDQSLVGMVAGARWAVTNEDAPPKDNEGQAP